jgi:hypothetical protein
MPRRIRDIAQLSLEQLNERLEGAHYVPEEVGRDAFRRHTSFGRSPVLPDRPL